MNKCEMEQLVTLLTIPILKTEEEKKWNCKFSGILFLQNAVNQLAVLVFKQFANIIEKKGL